MSYCRWSSDDFQCDVYVYESLDGWVIHVAGNRVVFTDPLPPPSHLRPGFTDAEFSAWFDRGRKVAEMVDAAERQPIGLPFDGETYVEDTPEGCADLLETLRAAGYNVPQYAIDALREEVTA